MTPLESTYNLLIKRINELEERLDKLEKRILTYGEYIDNARQIR